MRIERLAFKEHDTGWELAPTEFFSGVTLFVGASGVGKTRILRAIHTLSAIAQDRREGMLVSGVEWDFLFSLSDGQRFHWRGQYSGAKQRTPAESDIAYDGNYDDFEAAPRVLWEELVDEKDVQLIQRTVNAITFDGKLTPKLSPYASALSLLSHEEKIAPAYKGWASVLKPYDDPEDTQSGYVRDFSAFYSKYPTFEAIRESTLRTQHKLALVYKNAPEVFQRILNQYRDIFPTIESVRVRMESVTAHVPVPGRWNHQEWTQERPAVDIKEKSSASWIPQSQISSGMWRTLMHLARMALWPDGTVVLIDEFENSLGVNCLDAVTEYLNDNSRRLQFIITSHHPYVINNIPWKQWKVVRRNGSIVTASAADELGFDVRSRHDAFLKLINLEAYREGIAAP